MAASQSRTVHSKTHRPCPIHTRNIGPIGPISSTIPSPWIESLPKGRSDMPCMIQRATVPGKWLRPNHIWYIPRPTGSVLSTLEILDPSVQYPVLYHHLESSPYAKAGLICHAWFKELLYQDNGCVPITNGTFQDPQCLSYPHKKYWTHRSSIQYYAITLNRILTERQDSYALHDSKSYCTIKMAASQSRTVHFVTHNVCPIHTRNIGPIGVKEMENERKRERVRLKEGDNQSSPNPLPPFPSGEGGGRGGEEGCGEREKREGRGEKGAMEGRGEGADGEGEEKAQ